MLSMSTSHHRKPYRSIVAWLAAILLAACSASWAAEPRPINELPMFGGVEKTQSQKRADQQLIDDTLAYGITLEEGAQRMIARGFQFLDEGEPGMAMRRFNQAWLLDPENGSVYWGMAAAAWDLDGNLAETEGLFRRAESLAPEDANLQIDFARFYERAGMRDKAIERLERALVLDPQAVEAAMTLVAFHMQAREIEAACRYVAQALSGSEPMEDWIATEFRRLQQQCR